MEMQENDVKTGENEPKQPVSAKKVFVCPSDPAELSQCDSCQ